MTSQFRGVTFSKKSAKWQAAINMGGTHVHLGTYVTEQEAAVAFDRAALIVRGPDKAKINFPVSNYQDTSGNLIIDPATAQKLQAAASAEKGVEGPDGMKKAKRKRVDMANGDFDDAGQLAYLTSLLGSGQFNPLDSSSGGQLLLQHYLQLASGVPVQQQKGKQAHVQASEAAAWTGFMSVAAAAVPSSPSGQGAQPGADGSYSIPSRLMGLVPHLGSKAMGVLWEQDGDAASGQSKQVGAAIWQNGSVLSRQLHPEEGAARDWLAGMIELLANATATAAGAVNGASSSLPPMILDAQQQQQQQQLLDLFTGSSVGGGNAAADALSAALAALVGGGQGVGTVGSSASQLGQDLPGMMAQTLAAAAEAGGMPGGAAGFNSLDLVALLAAAANSVASGPGQDAAQILAAGGMSGSGVEVLQQAAAAALTAVATGSAPADAATSSAPNTASLAEAAPLMMLAGLMHEDTAATAGGIMIQGTAAIPPPPPPLEHQPSGGGDRGTAALPLFRA
ncbi:hypothetical protein CEUSTIGMA_g5486.t1 [Chlamydomonas eustigma]|uniref:AP2/ERF domain-containing protein n=1 Tax=Chlamydomonas eustigma TaxID=1157962 RepID=A0A250X4N2_9CHLO|nr:hypothetical protein CEUSTIGMA_g5486.t1 [Chlamydomonas eustigma]|eukprot:GAX78044.1 hypothetical protein CEUSTIGMA_g5486.t1 [Chlamydomonas eustigma]